MNVFLDTNIIYQDPFFRSFLSKILLEKAHSDKLTIFIPEVVFKEIKYKIVAKEEKLKKNILSSLSELSELQDLEIDRCLIEQLNVTAELIDFYEDKFRDGSFKLIKCDLNHYEKTLQLAVEKKAPFFIEKRSEFRDSLIWQVISDIVSSKKEEEHYFVTNNFKDFWNQDKNGIHSELKSDAPELKIFNSTKDLFDSIKHLSQSKSKKEFEKWYNQQDVSIDSLQEAIRKYLWNHIVKDVSNNIRAYDISVLYPDVQIGYINPLLNVNSVKIEEILSTELRSNYAQIDIRCSLDFQGEVHLPNHEKKDLSNTTLVELNSQFILTVGFAKDLLFKPISVNINQISF